MRISKRILGMAAACALSGQSAMAQEQVSENAVASITDWTVFVEENPKECWGVSEPTNTVNTRDGRVVAANRGQILLMVFYRPEKADGQVAFTGGYPFRDDSSVSVDIGGTEFTMFTDGEWAWTASASDDAKLVAAMKRGANAVVTGISSRGTTTKDTFSLLGFTAAVEDAEKRCTG